MATDFDDLIEHLLADIAFAGSRGLEAEEVENIVKNHHEHQQLFTSRSVAPNDLDAASQQPPVTAPALDLNDLITLVWQHLDDHPDINVTTARSTRRSQQDDGFDGASIATPSSRPGVYASEERIWQAIAGHGVDRPPLAPKLFELLEVVAAAGPDGILQPDATKLTGQDKHSVPLRTDKLAKGGYITKERAVVPKMVTSRLKHWKFVSRDSTTPAVAHEYDQWEGPYINPVKCYDTMISLLRENEGVAVLKDIQLETDCTTHHTRKALGKCLDRLERSGLLRRIRAKVEGDDGSGVEELIRCIQLLRDPTDLDRVGMKSKGGPLKSSKPNGAGVKRRHRKINKDGNESSESEEEDYDEMDSETDEEPLPRLGDEPETAQDTMANITDPALSSAVVHPTSDFIVVEHSDTPADINWVSFSPPWSRYHPDFTYGSEPRQETTAQPASPSSPAQRNLRTPQETSVEFTTQRSEKQKGRGRPRKSLIAIFKSPKLIDRSRLDKAKAAAVSPTSSPVPHEQHASSPSVSAQPTTFIAREGQSSPIQPHAGAGVPKPNRYSLGQFRRRERERAERLAAAQAGGVKKPLVARLPLARGLLKRFKKTPERKDQEPSHADRSQQPEDLPGTRDGFARASREFLLEHQKDQGERYVQEFGVQSFENMFAHDAAALTVPTTGPKETQTRPNDGIMGGHIHEQGQGSPYNQESAMGYQIGETSRYLDTTTATTADEDTPITFRGRPAPHKEVAGAVSMIGSALNTDMTSNVELDMLHPDVPQNAPADHNLDLPPFRFVPFAVDETESDDRAKNYKKQTVMYQGPLHVARFKVVTELVGTAGGIFPGIKEMYFPFTTKWSQSHAGTPAVNTMIKAINTLRQDGKLKKYEFQWTTPHGGVQNFNALMEPDVDPHSEQAREVQRRMIDAYPGVYMPERVAITESQREQCAKYYQHKKRTRRGEPVDDGANKRQRVSMGPAIDPQLTDIDHEYGAAAASTPAADEPSTRHKTFIAQAIDPQLFDTAHQDVRGNRVPKTSGITTDEFFERQEHAVIPQMDVLPVGVAPEDGEDDIVSSAPEPVANVSVEEQRLPTTQELDAQPFDNRQADSREAGVPTALGPEREYYDGFPTAPGVIVKRTTKGLDHGKAEAQRHGFVDAKARASAKTQLSQTAYKRLRHDALDTGHLVTEDDLQPKRKWARKRAGADMDLQRTPSQTISLASPVAPSTVSYEVPTPAVAPQVPVETPKNRGGWPKGRPRGPQVRKPKPSAVGDDIAALLSLLFHPAHIEHAPSGTFGTLGVAVTPQKPKKIQPAASKVTSEAGAAFGTPKSASKKRPADEISGDENSVGALLMRPGQTLLRKSWTIGTNGFIASPSSGNDTGRGKRVKRSTEKATPFSKAQAAQAATPTKGPVLADVIIPETEDEAYSRPNQPDVPDGGTVSTEFTDSHPDETWHHRGRGRWGRGLPGPGFTYRTAVKGPGAAEYNARTDLPAKVKGNTAPRHSKARTESFDSAWTPLPQEAASPAEDVDSLTDIATAASKKADVPDGGTVSKEYMESHLDETWHYRSRGRWARGWPDLSRTDNPQVKGPGAAAYYAYIKSVRPPQPRKRRLSQVDHLDSGTVSIENTYTRRLPPPQARKRSLSQADHLDSGTISIEDVEARPEISEPPRKRRRAKSVLPDDPDGGTVSTEYVNSHLEVMWHHRGNGRWARGEPDLTIYNYKTAVKGAGAKEYLARIGTKEGKPKKQGEVVNGQQMKLNGEPWKRQPVTVNGVRIQLEEERPAESPKKTKRTPSVNASTVQYEVPPPMTTPCHPPSGQMSGTPHVQQSAYTTFSAYPPLVDGTQYSSTPSPYFYPNAYSAPDESSNMSTPAPTPPSTAVKRKRPYTYKSRKQLSTLGPDGTLIELDRASDDDYTQASKPKKQKQQGLTIVQSNPKFKLDRKKLLTAVALVKTLCPSTSYQTMRWDLVALALGTIDEGVAAKEEYGSLSHVPAHAKFTTALQDEMQERFLTAMEKDELPHVNIVDLTKTDWPALLHWAETSVVPHITDESLKNVKKSVEVGEKNKTGLKPKKVAQKQANAKKAPKKTNAKSTQKQPIVDTAAVFPASRVVYPTDEASQLDLNEELIMAKSWIRANSATKDDKYDTRKATEKLAALGTPILQAVQDMQKSNTIRQLKSGRQRPGRNFEITQQVWSQFKKWPSDKDGPAYLRELADTRAKIVQYFAENEMLEKTTAPTEQEGLILNGLVAQGMLQMEIKLPPRNDDIDAPFPKLNAWSYGGYQYDTRKVERSLFDMPTVYTRTAAFSATHKLQTDIPVPWMPLPMADEALPRVPFWVDIHGNLIPDIWEMVLSSIIHCVVTKPGVNAMGIEKAHGNKLWAWEIELALQWMERVGIAERFGAGKEVDGVWRGGWTVGDEWVGVLGDEVAVWK